MTKRFLGLLLSVILIANSSTSVIAMEDNSSETAIGTDSELTADDFEEPGGESFEGAQEDQSLILISEESESSDSSGEDLTGEIPTDNYITDDALSEEDTSEDADAGDTS